MMPMSLILALALSTPEAAATYTPKIKNIRIRQTTESGNGSYRIVVIVKHDDNDEVANVETQLSSGGGSAEAELEDVQVALTGDFSALPVETASVELALTDAAGDSISTLTGTLSAEGSLALTVPTGRTGDAGDCTSRTGCGDADGGTSTTVDLDAQGAFVVDGDESFAFSLVLKGTDAASVAGASLSFTEEFVGDKECLATDEKGNCLKWGNVSWSEVVEVPLDVSGLEWVWGAELSEDFELGDKVKVTLTDAEGSKLDKGSLEPALPLDVGGAGIAASLVSAKTSTLLSMSTCDEGLGSSVYCAALVSPGWTAADATPQEASITVDGGETWTVPAHSYQASAWVPVTFSADPSDEVFALEQDGVDMGTFSSTMTCDVDTTQDLYACGAIEQDEDGQWGLALTVYAEDPSELPGSSKISLSPTVGKVNTKESTYEADFGDEYAVTFAVPVDFVEDPLGAEVAMDVELLGEAGKKGKQETLAKGSVGLVFDVNEDGSLVASGMDPDDITNGRGDILIGGEPIGIERTVGDEPVPTAPPVIQAKNGVGTRNLATTNTTKPGLL